VKVVFLEEVLGTAVPGDIKDVKDGFARNYLLPRGLAIAATKDALHRAEVLSKKEEKRQAGLDAEAQKVVEKLEGQKITIRARVGEQGRLYGSVTAADVAEKLGEMLGTEFDRRRVLLYTPIREAGSRMVTLRLTRNVNHQVEVEVEPEDTGRRRAASAEPLPPIIPDEEPEIEAREDEDDDDEDEDEDNYEEYDK
jgi:large subunit ribosomal protein L9